MIFPHDVPGWFTPAEGALLYSAAQQAGGLAVELGCYQGRSTIVLAQAAPAVVAIDDFQGIPEDGIAGGFRPALERHLRAYGVADRVQIIASQSDAWTGQQAALLFIDADHEYAREDWLVWRRHVTHTVAFHDVTAGDVAQAIALAEADGYQRVGAADALVILSR